MPSNEHPDMSGNPCDAPLLCDWCHIAMKEEKVEYELRRDGEDRFFCCEDCYHNYLDGDGFLDE